MRNGIKGGGKQGGRGEMVGGVVLVPLWLRRRVVKKKCNGIRVLPPSELESERERGGDVTTPTSHSIGEQRGGGGSAATAV